MICLDFIISKINRDNGVCKSVSVTTALTFAAHLWELSGKQLCVVAYDRPGFFFYYYLSFDPMRGCTESSRHWCSLFDILVNNKNDEKKKKRRRKRGQ